MFNYFQTSGILDRNGTVLLTAYSGHGPGLNNPALQRQHDIGPIPRGRYVMTNLLDSPHTGTATIILVADPMNEMFDRSGFRIHGDNAALNHSASNGCIIYGHAADRAHIWNSGDRDLMVHL